MVDARQEPRDRLETKPVDIAQFQEDWLWRRAEESRSFKDLLCYYAAGRDETGLERACGRVDPANDLDVLVLDLLTLGRDGAGFETVLERLDERAGVWMFYTLAKYLLGAGKVGEAVQVAGRNLACHRTDVTVLNLVIKYLIKAGELSTARELIDRSLRLDPLQRDIEGLRASPCVPYDLYLEVYPKFEEITFYLPAYNVEEFIRGAIEGLGSQNYPLKEILVIDDATPDRSIEIARQYPVVVVEHEENRGLAAARNSAFLNATGTLVGTIDTDAIPAADYTRNVMMEFENSPEQVVGVGGRLIEQYRESPPDLWRSLYLSQDPGDYRECPPPMLFGCNTVYRRAAIIAVGGYDEKYRTNAEDAYISQRLLRHGFLLSYTPHAAAYHKRRDTVESVLRTRWNYHYWYYTENGYYSAPERLIQLFDIALDMSAPRIKEDFENGPHQLLYLHVLVVFHNSFLDVNHAVATEVLDAAWARGIQEAMLGTLRSVDARFGGDLARRVRQDLEHLLQDAGPGGPRVPTAFLPVFEEFLTRLEGFCEGITEETYRAIASN